ncbi:unnamed protein product [Thlaspi arvense]|uniref:Uncharacterized protein n=1 Tax=Thlaspi arvense TaxID=13288 RepID=A0AAU9S4U1_THLAR|nr:unnamed protein product [Thlaspi arvense]
MMSSLNYPHCQTDAITCENAPKGQNTKAEHIITNSGHKNRNTQMNTHCPGPPGQSRSLKIKMERDSMKKVRVPCNFCDFFSSRSEQSLEEQDHEAVKEVERLRLLIKRMTGEDESVSFSELLALESHLQDVQLIVADQRTKVKLEEDERLRKQGDSFVSSEEEGQDDGTAPLLKMMREFERRSSESAQSELERLWLLNEYENEWQRARRHDFLRPAPIRKSSNACQDGSEGPKAGTKKGTDCKAAQSSAEQERCFSDDDTCLPLRLLLVSRELSKFHNRYYRRRRVQMKLKRRGRRDLTKKAGVLCDFCGLSSSSSRCEERPHIQDDEVVSEPQGSRRPSSGTWRMSRFLGLLLNEFLVFFCGLVLIYGGVCLTPRRRMSGRELVGVAYSELILVAEEIHRGLAGLHEQMYGPRSDQIAAQQKEH